jgi:transposase InsO family protein
MKTSHDRISISFLCQLFSVSRQAYYQHEWRLSIEVFEHGLLLDEIKSIRLRHNRIGARKLHVMLFPFMQEHGIKIGRDGLFDLLSSHGMLVRNRKRHVRTTCSYHWLRKYPNLIIDFTPIQPNQLWVCDITYWKTGLDVFYISLITDAFSRKIVGCHLSFTLHAEETVKSLKTALSGLGKDVTGVAGLIHHSDRGVQYCSSSYTNLLIKNNISISMTQTGDPIENAMAERVNGIIKDEYLQNYLCNSFEDARMHLETAVRLYNNERPHSSIGNFTPEYVHNHYNVIPKDSIKRLWKNYYTKRTAYSSI